MEYSGSENGIPEMNRRNMNLDFVRCIAILNVIAVHYLAHTGYYLTPIVKWGGYCFTIFRVIFITCVPLFLLLSGFLCSDKKLSKAYYFGIVKILLSYFLAGLVCQITDYSLYNGDIKTIVLSFFSFKAAPYGWYIGMYLGLFLLIPFINILWNALNLAGKRVFIVSLLVLTAVPCATNSFDLSKEAFWQGTQTSYTSFLPEYFIALYPISYYAIGCYLKIREDRIKEYNNNKIFICLVSIIMILGTLNYFKNYGIVYPWALDTSYGSYQSVMVATLIFIYIYKLTIEIHWIKRIVIVISKCSLSIYLLSYLTDKVFYHFFNIYINSDILKLVLLVPSVLVIIFGTLIIAYPINYFVMKFTNLLRKRVINN